MATRRTGGRKSKTKKAEETPIQEVVETPVQEISEVVETPAQKVIKTPEPKQEVVKQKPKQKYSIGSIVFLNKNAGADLNGFKLFPQYKKYTYTVEAYDEISGVYTLRRLNLSLRLTEDLILAPDERAHDSLNRKMF